MNIRIEAEIETQINIYVIKVSRSSQKVLLRIKVIKYANEDYSIHQIHSVFVPLPILGPIRPAPKYQKVVSL